MLTKILFTALIVMALLLYVRHQQTKQTNERPTHNSSKTSPQTLSRSAHRLSRIAAYTALALILAIGGVLYYLDWKEDYRVINIRIINTNTGEIGSYLAYRSMIRGRSFVTLDGRKITVADSERIEISEAD
jgi:hypothetical protein